MRAEVAPPVSDADLVTAARKGEPWAQRALFERHTRRVTGLAHRLLRGGPDVDDLVQDVFVSALTGLDRLEKPDAFGAWVSGITVRLASKRIRRLRLRRRLGFRSAEALPPDSLVSNSAPPDVGAELRAVYEVLDSLPAEAAVALVLRRVEGMTVPETAQAMNLSPATVKRRLAVAEKRLHAKLGKDR